MEIKIEELQQEIEAILSQHKDGQKTFHITSAPDGARVYTIETTELKLVVTIGNRWIGYDLEVDKSATGKEMGNFVDTDLYPIQGKYMQKFR